MERRDWSLEALKRLQYIDSLDEGEPKAQALSSWVSKYLNEHSKIENFDLEIFDLRRLEELFFKNILFLKRHHTSMKKELDEFKKISKFLK